MRWVCRRLGGDDGLTLVELMISLVISAVIGGVMLTLLVVTLQTDTFEQQYDVALAELRTAKSRLVKEVRFADALSLADSDAHEIEIWVDLDTNGVFTPGTGEAVVWSLEVDGTLTRSDDAGNLTQHARSLVYDPVAGPDASRFLYDAAGSTVTIQLVADVDGAGGPRPIRVATKAHVRNM